MRKLTSMAVIILLCIPASGRPEPADGFRQVVICNGKATELNSKEKGQLWITPTDLTRATKLVLKPEGVCDDERCFPIPQERKGEFLKEGNGKTWFNLSDFARHLKQPVAHDVKHGVWYLGPRPDVRNGYLATLVAPDFTLPDMQGKNHSLSEFRGKKVLLLTWASW